MWFRGFPKSIKGRLILTPIVIVAAALILAIFVSLFDSNSRIRLETQSGTELGKTLLGYALRTVETAPDPDQAIARLMLDLRDIRHVRFVYLTQGGTPAATPPELAPAHEITHAPDWFVDLFRTYADEQVFPIAIGDRSHGEIIMIGFPRDEIDEIWGELVFLVSLLAAVSLLIIAAIVWASRAALRPVRALAQGLDRMSQGRFETLPPFDVIELHPIRDGFNHLVMSLRNVERDNHLLIDKLISVQETERRDIARELHDDFGATLFGARAELSLLADRASACGTCRGAVVAHAKAVSHMIDDIQQQNVRILERLRPMVLAHMDTVSALRDMIEVWAARHPDVTLRLTIDDKVQVEDATVGLALYRTVQECLTNIDRHATASDVRIDLTPASATTLRLTIEDNGIGLAADFRKGFGLLGMTERIRQLGGYFRISNRAPHGVAVEARLPLAVSADRMESVLSDA